MDREFALSLLSEKRDLLRRILLYNASALQEADAVYAGADPQLLEAICQDGHLKRKLQQKAELEFDFANRYNRLVFLEKGMFAVLEKMISGCVCSSLLLGQVLQADVLSSREILGEEIYELSLGRGGLYFPQDLKDTLTSRFVSTQQALESTGPAILNFMKARADETFAERIAFDHKVSVSLNLSEAEQDRVSACVYKIIYMELDGSCRNIFS